MGEVGAIWVTLGLRSTDLDTKLAEAQKKIGAVGDKLQEIGKKASIAGAAITAAFGAVILKTTALGDDFNDLSQHTGIAVETLSSFKLAADKSGTSIGGFATGMKGLSRAMADAASGGKESKEAFDALGVSATDSTGNLRPLDQVMLDVADKFAQMPDGAQKSALAMQLFGKAGTELIPVLNLGREGLEAEAEASRKLGIVWSSDAAKAADQFQDSLVELKGSLQGVGQTITAAVLPIVQTAVTAITGIISKVREWMAAHPGLTTAIGTAALALGGLLTVIGPVTFAFGTILKLLPAVTSALGATTGGLIASTAAFCAGAAVLAIYIGKLLELSAAEDRAEGATRALWEKENDLIDKLSAAASAADWQYGRMSKLIQAYNFNYIALIKDIQAGKLGIDIQKAFAEACKKHAAEVDKLQKSTTGLTAATKSLAEELGIVLRSEIEDRIKKLNEALITYRGKMTADEVKRICEEIQTLAEKLKALKGPVMDVEKTIQDMLNGLDNTSEEVAKAISDLFRDGFEDIKKAGEQVIENDLPSYLRNLPPVVKEVTDSFGELADDMAKAFGEAFANIIRDGLNFANFFKSLMQGIINAIATAAGKALTNVFEPMFSKLVAGFAKVAASISPVTAAIVAATVALVAFFDFLKKGWEGIATVTETTVDLREEWEKAFKTISDAIKGVKTSTEDLEDAWSELLSHAKKAGQEGSKWLIDLIKAFRASGKESKVLNEYMQSWLDTIPDALSVLIDGIKVVTQKLDDLSEGFGRNVEIVTELANTSGRNVKSVADKLAEMGRIAVLTFNAMLASGKSWIETVEAMAGPLDALREKYKQLGLEADPALARLFRIVGITRKHKELFEQIDATRQILIALGNSAWLTADAWKTLTGQAVSQFHMLRHNGLSVADSLRAMAPTLQAIVNYAATYGLQLDAQTQSLIRQAQQLGIVKDAQKTTGAVLVEGFNRVCDILIKIAEVLGADVSGFMDDITESAGTLSKNMALTKDSLGTLKTKSKEPIKNIKTISDIVDAINTCFGKIFDVLVEIARVLGADISGFMDDIVDKAKEFTKEGGRARDAWEWERDRGGRDREGGKGYAYGGIAWTPQVAQLAERGPEIIMPLRDYRADAAPSAGGRNGPVTVNIKPLLIDKKDHYLIEFIQENLDHHVFRVPTAVVGG